MSFFGSKLFGLGGSTGTENSNFTESSLSGAETIERLCDRLLSSLLIEDRHDSLKAIKSLTKKYKLEVGTQAMPVLIDVLIKNKNDPELCCLALDTLFMIMNPNNSNQEQDSDQILPADISTQFTEMFIKDNANLILLFDLLDEFEFQIRWSSVKLINQLIQNQIDQLQEKILQIPRGVSRLIDLLNDSREIIRNESILILSKLTKTNANIQKIIAFESGFDRIMEIIESEGSVLDGGVIVEDCFNLLLCLLETNYSNQNFFKEANYIKKICKFFDLNNSNSTDRTISNSEFSDINNWTKQKVTNISLLLKLIRCLVAPNNQQQIIYDCQKAYNHFGLLHRLCALLTWPGVPADLLSQAISTVGEVIRGNSINQQLFSTVMMQTNPPRPIIIILLLSMINEKQSFQLRCSILYCIECFLYKNEEKKGEIIQTLLPKDISFQQSSQINIGQILCTGLFAPNDFVSNWLCAVALAHTINDNNSLKEQLLRVQLAVNDSSSNNAIQAVSLLQQCMNILIESSILSNSNSHSNSSNQSLHQFQTTISFLMLICTWLSDCNIAVNAFLSNEQNIPYLISQASATDTEEKSIIIQGISSFCLGLIMVYNSNQITAYSLENLKDTIKKRIGIEQFEHKLEFISQHEFYIKCLKQPKFAFTKIKPSDLLFDYEFTRLFKTKEALIMNILKNKCSNLTNGGTVISSNLDINPKVLNALNIEQQIEQQNAVILSQYQQIIREQDAKLKEQQQLNSLLAEKCSELQLKCQEYKINLEQFVLSSNLDQHYISEKLQYQARINELEVKSNLLEEKCSDQEDELCKIQREKGILQETINNLKNAGKNTDLIEIRTEYNNLKKNYDQLTQEQESLLTLLQEMEIKLKKYKKILKKHDENVSENEDDDDNYSDNLENFSIENEKNEVNNVSKLLHIESSDESITNNLQYIPEKNNQSSDSNTSSNHYENGFMYDSQISSNTTNSSSSNYQKHSQSAIPTGQNIDLAIQAHKSSYFDYFNNQVQTELFLKNSQIISETKFQN